MPQWLGQASQGCEMFCRDPEVMGLNPGWIELSTHSPMSDIQCCLKFCFQIIPWSCCPRKCALCCCKPFTIAQQTLSLPSQNTACSPWSVTLEKVNSTWLVCLSGQHGCFPCVVINTVFVQYSYTTCPEFLILCNNSISSSPRLLFFCTVNLCVNCIDCHCKMGWYFNNYTTP